MKVIEIAISPLDGPVRVTNYIHGVASAYTDYHKEFKTRVVGDSMKVLIEAAPEDCLPHAVSKTIQPTRIKGHA